MAGGGADDRAGRSPRVGGDRDGPRGLFLAVARRPSRADLRCHGSRRFAGDRGLAIAPCVRRQGSGDQACRDAQALGPVAGPAPKLRFAGASRAGRQPHRAERGAAVGRPGPDRIDARRRFRPGRRALGRGGQPDGRPICGPGLGDACARSARRLAGRPQRRPDQRVHRPRRVGGQEA